MHPKAIFMRDVKEMKAWQLYAGQSVWFFAVGIVFYLLKMLLDMTSLKRSKSFNSAYSLVESIGTGKAGATDGEQFAKKILDPKDVNPMYSGMY